MTKRGSSEIWSDKVSLLHIKGTQRGGEQPRPLPHREGSRMRDIPMN